MLIFHLPLPRRRISDVGKTGGKCDEDDNGKGSGDSETREMAEQANQMKPFIKCKTFLGATNVTKGRQYPKKNDLI